MSTPKIIFIDDEEDIRTFVQVSLEVIAGFEVLLASSGAEGLEMAAREKPVAILLNVVMPDMEGPEVLEKLRQDERCIDIPVIFLTARSQVGADRASEIAPRLGGLGEAAPPHGIRGECAADHLPVSSLPIRQTHPSGPGRALSPAAGGAGSRPQGAIWRIERARGRRALE